MKFRFRLVQFFFCLGFGLIVFRLAYLQLWLHDDLSEKAKNQLNRWVQEAPSRGSILDRYGNVLVESVRVPSCFADPTLIKDTEKVINSLSGLLGISRIKLKEKIQKAPGSFIWIKKGISVEVARQIQKENLEGIGLKWEYKRSYPNGNLAIPLLGYVGDHGNGLSGLEHRFNAWLKDTRTPQLSFRDGHGKKILASMERENKGNPWLRLTLDRTLQYITEKELAWGMKRSQATSGVAIVQDPHTGEILAMASQPHRFSPEERLGTLKGLSIPSAQWVFEPGSTFKIVTAAAALEEKLVYLNEVFDCEKGEWDYKGITINDHEPQKFLTFKKIMEVSSNVGFAKVGIKVGKEKLYEYIRAFGFGLRTGSEIPGESPGLLRTVPKWSGVSLPILSFGQEIGITALQLVCAYSVVANGGILYEPQIYQEIKDQQNKHKKWREASKIRRVISKETAFKLNGMLQQVVESRTGTGTRAALSGWTVAGKTGTAQKIDPELKTYSKEKYVASFCGFVPASKPRLSIVVIINEPKDLYWGGYNAGPVFKNIAQHALTYLDVPSDKLTEVAQLPREN